MSSPEHERVSEEELAEWGAWLEDHDSLNNGEQRLLIAEVRRLRSALSVEVDLREKWAKAANAARSRAESYVNELEAVRGERGELREKLSGNTLVRCNEGHESPRAQWRCPDCHDANVAGLLARLEELSAHVRRAIEAGIDYEVRAEEAEAAVGRATLREQRASEDLVDEIRKREAAQERAEEAETNLRKFGWHKGMCPVHEWLYAEDRDPNEPEPVCACGWADVQRELEGGS